MFSFITEITNGQLEVKRLCDAVKTKLKELIEKSNETGFEGIVDTALITHAVDWISSMSNITIQELQNYSTM